MGILIVDDSPFNLFYFRNELHGAGYPDVWTAGSAAEALEILGIEPEAPPRESVDLILMDIEMPGLNGVDACRRIKSSGKGADIPIIFVTANKTHLNAAFDAGGMDFIEKGCERIELLARVKSALSLKRETDGRKVRERKLTKELLLARQIQRCVLSEPIDSDRIQIHSVYRQSEEVSGDMLYWAQMDDQRYGVILIDVSGHGLSSAFVSMSIRSLLTELMIRGLRPERIYEDLNRHMIQLFGGSKRFMYFTAIFAAIDTENRWIEYFNAGHPPGLLLHPDAEAVKLSGTCIPIGMKLSASPRVERLPYRDGTRLLLYTDGLVETPGRPISDAVEALKTEAIRRNGLRNTEFVEQIAGLKKTIFDDVCVISILLNSSSASIYSS
ncbi:fused response regulator/phosphatase [Paenibacillus sp.]|uniref:PP2C family protein-serine/threonine phosphatase n=1 Tax=Paenibacillus sp. TaxID=58172 RepID=UPI002810A565|nr:fused response regulator/phosphatase [Paenibacillus sp.]